MSTEFNAPIQACTDPRHTGALRARFGCNGPDPAGSDSSPATASPESAAPPYVRGFRLIQRNGNVLDAAQFPNGRVIVLDDPDLGLCSGARSLELLLRSGYHGARAEFADGQPSRRRLTPREHDRAWHAIEGTAGEPGADPGTILNAVLHALRIDAPTAAEEQAASPAKRPTDGTR
ncbi:hypothetical protein [Streptomyces cyaneofuscatus]|uniref:hypothetical protein n=1 Tax=Streptomyces cyaneofuscatus TaxID=66883 RepID=UPI00381FEDE1